MIDKVPQWNKRHTFDKYDLISTAVKRRGSQSII